MTKRISSSTPIAAPNPAPEPVAASSSVDVNEVDASILLSELRNLRTKKDLSDLFKRNNSDPRKVLETIRYEEELEKLQIELVKLQRWVQAKGKRIAILFEGRDAAGKGGTIRRFTEHLNPRAMRVVALPKPTEEEKGQWYFQRYAKQLPNRGEIVFFDRSWYNRAVVEPVNNFCTEGQYDIFMQQVPEFEHMLYEDGLIIIKFWFSISKEEQLNRFKSRKANPLKQWKLSPVDMQAQEKWTTYTKFKEQMFSKTHTSFSPWIIVKANNKQKARLESIRYVLSIIPYEGKDKSGVSLYPNPNIITRFHRNAMTVD
ncbi:polyphosphate kinase 2 [Runella limosa]|uniref:polyphosphate kinase 2 n=1 Tax=Runella limosa TaxID=370978 RepID=UPI00041236DA|nr:polyphosphate kinase 2 [Runella limosa]